LYDKKEAQTEGARGFQREGPATEKDLDLATVVLVRGTKSSRLSKERRERRDEAEVGSRMASQRYLGATPICALRSISLSLYPFAKLNSSPLNMPVLFDNYLPIFVRSAKVISLYVRPSCSVYLPGSVHSARQLSSCVCPFCSLSVHVPVCYARYLSLCICHSLSIFLSLQLPVLPVADVSPFNLNYL